MPANYIHKSWDEEENGRRRRGRTRAVAPSDAARCFARRRRSLHAREVESGEGAETEGGEGEGRREGVVVGGKSSVVRRQGWTPTSNLGV